VIVETENTYRITLSESEMERLFNLLDAPDPDNLTQDDIILIGEIKRHLP